MVAHTPPQRPPLPGRHTSPERDSPPRAIQPLEWYAAFGLHAARIARGAVVLAALAVPAVGEDTICTLSRAALVKNDLQIDLYTDGTAGSTAAVTVTAKETRTGGSTDYLIAGLTDATAGAATDYLLVVEDPVTGEVCRYAWPLLTRTPQSVVWNPVHQLAPGSSEIRAGDTLPEIELLLAGLAADPTSATVTFSLFRMDGTAARALAQSVSSLSRSGATVTVDMAAAHDYETGQTIYIAGATPTAYNGAQTITVTDSDSFTYTVSGTPTTPATGTITAARVIQDMDADLVDVDSVVDPITSDTTYTAVLGYSWRTGDTTSLASTTPTNYYVQFKLTLAAATCGDGDDACVITAPPARTALIKVY